MSGRKGRQADARTRGERAHGKVSAMACKEVGRTFSTNPACGFSLARGPFRITTLLCCACSDYISSPPRALTGTHSTSRTLDTSTP
nr:hypothetical protein CFP56_68111 [Quercus suber]